MLAHILVNGKKLTIPSHKVKVGDVITVREGSKQSGVFNTLAETHEAVAVPAWLSIDIKKLTATMTGLPVYNPAETLFDPEQVLEYYSRQDIEVNKRNCKNYVRNKRNSTFKASSSI